MQAAVTDAIAKVSGLQAILDESADQVQSGVYLRLCNASKELYASMQALKEQGLQEDVLADEQSRAEQLARWVADPVRAFFWPELAELLVDPGQRWAALEAMQELFNEEPHHRENAAGWDDICRNLVGILRHESGLDAGEETRTNATLTMAAMVADCEAGIKRLVEFGLLARVVYWLRHAGSAGVFIRTLARLVSDLLKSNDRAIRERVRTENGLIAALVARLRMTSMHYLDRDAIAGALCEIVETKDVLRGDVKKGVQSALEPATRMLLKECGHFGDPTGVEVDDEFEAVRLLKNLVLLEESIVEALGNHCVFARLIEIDAGLCPDITREDIVHLLEKAASWSPTTRQKLADQGVYKLIASTLENFRGIQTGVIEKLCALVGWLTYNVTENDMRTMRELQIPKLILGLLSIQFLEQRVVSQIMEVVRNLCNIAAEGMHEDLLNAGVVAKLSAVLRDPSRGESHNLAEDSLGMLSMSIEKGVHAPTRSVQRRKRVLGE